MNKKPNYESVFELTQNELSAIEKNDKLDKLMRENAKDKKIIAEFKEREKSSARALVLYERKIKYLKQVLSAELVSISENLNDDGQICQKFHEVFDEDELELTEVLKEIQDIKASLEQMVSKVQTIASISKSDRDFILNKPQTTSKSNETAEERFSRLKQEFNQKIGSSVNRKRGRPKRGEQSIVADIGLGKKPEKAISNAEEIEDKFNELFYASPSKNSQKSNVPSAIPQTEDSLFDFNEALNPNISLKDIMADIMGSENGETSFAGNFDLIEQTENVENKNLKTSKLAGAEGIKQFKQKTNPENLEAGIIHKPTIQKRADGIQPANNNLKKTNFDKHFISLKNIVDD